MYTFEVKTLKKDDIIDITGQIEEKVSENDVKNGLVHLLVLHTTCSLTTADLDPGTDEDILEACRAIIPQLNYRHPHDPKHVPDHILSAIIGCSITLPVHETKLVLGVWQRVILIEFDGPRKRKIAYSFIGL